MLQASIPKMEFLCRSLHGSTREGVNGRANGKNARRIKRLDSIGKHTNETVYIIFIRIYMHWPNICVHAWKCSLLRRIEFLSRPLTTWRRARTHVCVFVHWICAQISRPLAGYRVRTGALRTFGVVNHFGCVCTAADMCFGRVRFFVVVGIASCAVAGACLFFKNNFMAQRMKTCFQTLQMSTVCQLWRDAADACSTARGVYYMGLTRHTKKIPLCRFLRPVSRLFAFGSRNFLLMPSNIPNFYPADPTARFAVLTPAYSLITSNNYYLPWNQWQRLRLISPHDTNAPAIIFPAAACE